MITKHVIPIVAVTLVLMMVLPGYAMAADGNTTVTNQISLAIDSEHAGQYSDVVNVAEETAITNPDTWDPSPQGIWIGASTEESLFQINTVATPYNRFHVASEVRFNSTQIMNGASETIVRSPIAADGVQFMYLRVYRLITPGWEIGTLANEYAPINCDGYVSARADIDPADTSITTGGDSWNVNGRIYVRLYAPLYSDISYVFAWTAIYNADERFKVYLSGQDIANDGLMTTKIGQFTLPTPDRDVQDRRTFALDPGISFDMITGLGAGIWANSFYFNAGDSVQFKVPYISNAPNIYHTLMVPFSTIDGQINATVKVEHQSGANWVTDWQDSDTVWTEYILACSNNPISVGIYPLRVTITFNQPERVNLMFMDSPRQTLYQNMEYNTATLNLDGVAHTVQSRLWSSYQYSVGAVYKPSLIQADFPPPPEPQVNQQGNYYGTIIGIVLVAIGGAMIATAIGAPIGAVVAGIGTAMIIADLAKGGNLVAGETLPGFLRNTLDVAWDVLVGIGEFLRSVGEALYDAIIWIADAVNEYLPILLGLLIIGIALALFFGPIFVQLKLWGIIWTLSEGKVQEAAAQAQGLVDTGKSALNELRGR